MRYWDDSLNQLELDEACCWNELRGTETGGLVKCVESVLGFIMDGLFEAFDFGMLSSKVSLITAFISFLWAILLRVLEARHHLLIELRHWGRHGAQRGRSKISWI